MWDRNPTVANDLDCLILAAGASSRFGACKLAARWRGQPLLTGAVKAAKELHPRHIMVVTGAWHRLLMEEVAPLCPEARFVYCPEWSGGMGSSLAFGAAQLLERRPLLIMLGDTPGVRGEDLRNLWQLWRKDTSRIACAAFANTSGVPAIFPADTKTVLREISGERGAQRLLNPQAQTLPMPLAALDIDTPQDLIRLEENHRDKTYR